MHLLLVPLLVAGAFARPQVQSKIASGVWREFGFAKCYVQVITTFGLTSATKNCGGCLVAPGDRVITAASCVSNNGDVDAKYIKITGNLPGLFFPHLLFQVQPDDVKVTVKSVHLHPNFKHDKFYSGSDIAVLMLANVPKTNQYFAPATLATENADNAYVGQNLVVCGHGFTNDNRIVPATISCTNLRVVSNDNCVAAFEPGTGPDPALDKFFCTKNPDDRNVCNGDNGAPVFNYVGASQKAMGVVSLFPDFKTSSPCKGGHHAVHTQIGAYLDFINDPLSG